MSSSANTYPLSPAHAHFYPHSPTLSRPTKQDRLYLLRPEVLHRSVLSARLLDRLTCLHAETEDTTGGFHFWILWSPVRSGYSKMNQAQVKGGSEEAIQGVLFTKEVRRRSSWTGGGRWGGGGGCDHSVWSGVVNITCLPAVGFSRTDWCA